MPSGTGAGAGAVGSGEPVVISSAGARPLCHHSP